jgi:mannose-6-phosphate isomerase-like protein (cupin superfamily)
MKILLCAALIYVSFQSHAQLYWYSKIKQKQKENQVTKISEDSLYSTFLIVIPKKVALHFHKTHSENIVVIGGKAIMKLGNDTLVIQKGDQLTIPMNTPHEVIRVISKKPLTVYSIQSPKFDGSDRFLLKP